MTNTSNSGKIFEIDVLGVYINYEYLKLSDLNWIFGVITTAFNEVRRQIETKENMVIHPKSTPLVVDYITTEKSLDAIIGFITPELALDLADLGLSLFTIYEYLKKESMDKRYTGRRNNLKYIVVRIIRRKYKYKDGELVKVDEKIKEKFEMDIHHMKE